MFCAIPFEINAGVSRAVPVRLHWVVVADELLEVQGVLFIDILDPKVVDNKGEGDGASLMEIKARRILGRVPSRGKDFFELLVGKFTSLLEASRGSLDFNVDEVVGGDFGSKVVVLDDVRREIGKGNVHVLKPV